MTSTTNILNSPSQRDRLSKVEALTLAETVPFLELAQAANTASKKCNGNRVAYLIDCNINHHNVCITGCRFCAFSRPLGHADAWELTTEQLDVKLENAKKAGATRVLLQGGMHPKKTIKDYELLINHIKTHHNLHIHALSPPEIDFLAKTEKTGWTEVIARLKKAGLDSIPGGGAEILVDRVRKRVSPKKCSTAIWLGVMEAAHKLGIKTTATMMMGHAETWADRVEHLSKIRELQDKTGGFISFIAWTFQPANTQLDPALPENTDIKLASSYEYLRLVAIARLFLDNCPHIQASTLTQGEKIAQIALSFGADDIGSVMLEEKVVAAAGCQGALAHTEKQLVRAIIDSGHEPYRRDSEYNEIAEGKP